MRESTSEPPPPLEGTAAPSSTQPPPPFGYVASEHQVQPPPVADVTMQPVSQPPATSADQPAPPAEIAPPPSIQPAPPDGVGAPSFIQPAPPAMQVGYPPPPIKTKRSVGKIVTIILLSLALAGALGFMVMYMMQLDEARSQISDQEREIKEQKDLIDKKETFGAAMESLLDLATTFDGALMHDIVPTSDYEAVAQRAWADRWDSTSVDADTKTVLAKTDELESLREKADTEASTNATGTTYEAVIDNLGGGYVTIDILPTVQDICGTRPGTMACVFDDDPYVVKFGGDTDVQPWVNSWIRTGLAYHEFAHVLQITNPGPTETAAAAFDGDWETMADCYSLVYLDGWTLDHRVWVSSRTYWDVSMGYGYTCNDSQRQVVIDWYEQLGYHTQPISQ